MIRSSMLSRLAGCALALLLLAAVGGMSTNRNKKAAAYEPPPDPVIRIWQARVTRFQLMRLEGWATVRGVSLKAAARAAYGVDKPTQLSISQAAQLLIYLQRRAPGDISEPHNLDNWFSSRNDRTLNIILFPLARIWRL